MKKRMPQKVADEFFCEYGRALSGWADIEHVLALWFGYLTGARENQYVMGQVFGSARSFNANRDMLYAAFYASRRSKELEEFFRNAMKRVESYYATRNFMAHHQTFYLAKQRRMVLAKRTDHFFRGRVLFKADLTLAAKNFSRLQSILLRALPSIGPRPPLTLKQGLTKILRLPPDACATGSGRAPRRRPLPQPFGVR